MSTGDCACNYRCLTTNLQRITHEEKDNNIKSDGFVCDGFQLCWLNCWLEMSHLEMQRGLL